MKENQEFTDIICMLADIAQPSSPNPLRQASARRNYMAHVSQLKQARLAKAQPVKRTVLAFFRFAAQATLIFLVMAGMLTGTVYASSAAVPGDLLYPLELEVEEIQLKLTKSPEEAVYLSLSFAGERLAESSQLVASGREEHLVVALDAYRKIISGPILTNVKDSPTQQALSALISETLTSHEHELQRVRSHASVHNQLAFDNALHMLNIQREKHLSTLIPPVHTLDDALGETDSPEPGSSVAHEPATPEPAATHEPVTHGVMPPSLPYPMDEDLLTFYPPNSLPVAPPGLSGSFPPGLVDNPGLDGSNPPGQGNPGGGNPNPPGQGNPGGGNPNPPGQGNPGGGNPNPPGEGNPGGGNPNPPGNP
jgi:hypothetical protein